MDLPIDDLYTDDNSLALAASMGVRLREMIEDVEDSVDTLNASHITRVWI